MATVHRTAVPEPLAGALDAHVGGKIRTADTAGICRLDTDTDLLRHLRFRSVDTDPDGKPSL